MTFDFAWEIGSSVTYEEAKRLSELASGRKVLEIGSWLGRSAVAMASTAELVLSVDWHKGDYYSGSIPTLEGLRSNLERHGATNVEVIVARIEDIWQDLPRGFGLIFIDADHSAESAQSHWEIALQLIAPDGIIVFHDYGRFGVTEVVDGLGKEFAVTESLAVIEL